MDMSSVSPASSAGAISPRSTEDRAPLLSPHPLPGPKSPAAPTLQTRQNHVRQNHVSSANLYGVNIVCLWIDAKERLCLAQISNTLLKDYSYNEIHNRRVALGITCVQCTPVQLEILRRAGAMPVSSRRCGMITKREAERLVKSFLEEMAPPKLPDDFAFDVSHDCGWGCRGSFMPSRYNSSRAKCVKCYYCNMYFSPNKFIFHFHRMPDSKYQHPDAANFNSWRRHLVLTDPAHSDEMMHAWEDVKAMFNGGSRKRVMASSAQSFTKNQDQNNAKRMKSSVPVSSESHPASSHSHTQPKHNVLGPGFHRFPGAYPFPMFAAGAPKNLASPKPFPIIGQHFHGPEKLAPPHPHLPRQFPGAPFPPPAAETVYPSYEMIWAKHLGISMYNENSCYPPKCLADAKRDITSQDPSQKVPESEPKFTGQFSAFKPVSGVSLFKPYEDLESSRDYSEKDSGSDSAESDSENIDVDTVDDDNKQCIKPAGESNKAQISSHHSFPRDSVITSVDNQSSSLASQKQGPCSTEPNTEVAKTQNEADAAQRDESEVDALEPHNEADACGPGHVINTEMKDEQVEVELKCDKNENCVSTSHDEEEDEQETANREQYFTRSSTPDEQTVMTREPHVERVLPTLEGLSKVELQQELATALETRRRLEDEFNMIKNTFEKQTCQENAYREEMGRQIQVVRESLCRELEHERKTRASLQMKLKEAQEAMTKFSYQMLDTGPC